MRTAILIGASILAEAIRPYWTLDESVGRFFAAVVLVCVVMDVIDFFRDRSS